MSSIIWGFICVLPIVLLFTFLQYERRGMHTVLLLASLMVVFLFLNVAEGANLRIVVTDSKMIFCQGHYFMRRTIHYNEILDIAFKNSAKYTDLNRHYGRRKFAVGRNYPEIIIKLRDGDHFIVGGSRYAEEILSAIKLARPHINID